MNVLDCLNKGKQHAKTRNDVVLMTGLSDRKVRREIRKLRLAGHLIVSSAHGKGYYIAADPKEILVVIREAKSRIQRENEVIKAMEQALSTYDQIEI